MAAYTQPCRAARRGDCPCWLALHPALPSGPGPMRSGLPPAGERLGAAGASPTSLAAAGDNLSFNCLKKLKRWKSPSCIFTFLSLKGIIVTYCAIVFEKTKEIMIESLTFFSFKRKIIILIWLKKIS
jgi:hypothetical protein